MTRILRPVLVVLVASLAYGVAVGDVAAQSYPTKPLHMIVPFAAGGSPDIIGRMVAEDLGTALGQSVVVENRARCGWQHCRSIRDRSAGRWLHASARDVRQHGIQQGALSQLEV